MDEKREPMIDEADHPYFMMPQDAEGGDEIKALNLYHDGCLVTRVTASQVAGFLSVRPAIEALVGAEHSSPGPTTRDEDTPVTREVRADVLEQLIHLLRRALMPEVVYCEDFQRMTLDAFQVSTMQETKALELLRSELTDVGMDSKESLLIDAVLNEYEEMWRDE